MIPWLVSANLPTDQVKPALSSHLMVVTHNNVFSTIITKMSIANSLVLIFYYFGCHCHLSIACAISLVTTLIGNCHHILILFFILQPRTRTPLKVPYFNYFSGENLLDGFAQQHPPTGGHATFYINYTSPLSSIVWKSKFIWCRPKCHCSYPKKGGSPCSSMVKNVLQEYITKNKIFHTIFITNGENPTY